MAITNLIDSVLDARDVGTGKIKRYDSALEGVGKTGASAGAALGIATAAVGALALAVGAGVRELLSHQAAVDEIGKQSQLLDLRPEEFDRYRIAASLAGVATNTTLKGLQTFRRVAEEEFAGKKTIFAEIGVDIETAAGGLRDFDELLKATLTALNSQPELRLRGAEEIFGGRGAGLLRLGSGADLGGTLGDLERRGLGRSESQTGAAADLIDAQTLLGESNEALRGAIEEVLAPSVQVWIEKLDGVTTAILQNKAGLSIGGAAVLESIPGIGLLFQGAAARAAQSAAGVGGAGGVTDPAFVGPLQIDPEPIATALALRIDKVAPELLGVSLGGEPLERGERVQFADLLDRLDRFIAVQTGARPGRMDRGTLDADLIELPIDEVHELNAAYQKQFEILDQSAAATAGVIQLTDAIGELAGTSSGAVQIVVRLIQQLAAAIESAGGGDPSGAILKTGLTVLGGAFGGPAGAAAGNIVGGLFRESAHRGAAVEDELSRAARSNPTR